jgi:hypothetical protein
MAWLDVAEGIEVIEPLLCPLTSTMARTSEITKNLILEKPL